MEERAGGRVPRLVDVGSRAVYKLAYGKQLIASRSYLDSLGDPAVVEGASVAVPVHPCAFYVEVGKDVATREQATVQVRCGSLTVAGETVEAGAETKKLSSGSLLQVGDLMLQFQISNLKGESLNVKRLLPRTPRQLHQEPEALPTVSNDVKKAFQSTEEQDESHVDEALRAELKRVSKEIYGRKNPDHRPPPPYEQVANSIAYQLLLHSRKSVSATFIQSFYAVLKKIERLEPSVLSMYTDYVKQYEGARETGATAQCMHPADIPTVQFLVQLIFHMCSHPALSEVAADSGPKWMQLLSIFSESPQNHSPLVQCRAWSYLLSTMKLTLMAKREPFQRYGWVTLTNLMHTSPVDDKPIISEQILILALDIATAQMDKTVDSIPLITAVIEFLSVLAAKATKATRKKVQKGRIFTTEQGAQVLQLLRTYEVLRRLMELPESLRQDRDYNRAYHALIRAMAPVTRDGSTKKASDASSRRRPCAASAPTVVQLVKVRTNTSSRSLGPPSPLPLPPSQQLLVASEGPGQSMRLSASMFSISSQAERKRRKLPSIPQTRKSHSLKVRSERRTKSLGQDEWKDAMVSTPEAIPPKPPRLAHRQKALSAADSMFIPKSISEFNIVFIASQDESHQLGQSLDLHDLSGLKAAQSLQTGVDSLSGDVFIPVPQIARPERTDQPPASDPSQLCQTKMPQDPLNSLTLVESLVNSQEVLSPQMKDAAPITAAAQAPRPTTWRASMNDPLNIEVSKLLSELTVCPEVFTSSLNSTVGVGMRDCATNGSIEPEGIEVVTTPSSDTATHADDGSCFQPVVGTGDLPVVLRRKKYSQWMTKEVTPKAFTDQTSPPKTPTDQTRLPKTPTDQTSAPKTPTDQTSALKTPTDQKSAPKTPTDQTSAPKTPTDQTGAPKAPTDQTSSPKIPTDQTVTRSNQDMVSHSLEPMAKKGLVSETSIEQGTVSKLSGDHVTVPKTSLNYFRQSVKRKKGGGVSQGSPSLDLHHTISFPEQAEETPSVEYPWRANRRSWSQSSLLMELPRQDDTSLLFELSGVHLSSESAALEGIVAEHLDIIDTLDGRQEVLEKITGLWYGDKGLQAATNAVMACFSEDNDVSLFTNILQLFSSFTPPWSLSVCLVVLPTLQQLLQSLREPHHFTMVCTVVHWIVEHFSELILSYRIPQRSQRLQALEDREKKIMCYRQLHQMYETIGTRLEGGSDSDETAQTLITLHTSLQPFSEQELLTTSPP